MYPIPRKIRMYSPAVTAGGWGVVKKKSAWSAGAVRKRSAVLITAKTAAPFGLKNNKIRLTSGSTNPTIIKYAANP